MTITLTDRQKFGLATEAQRQARFYHSHGNVELHRFWQEIMEALITTWNVQTTLIIKACEQDE